jgi:hypothetical protein
MEFSRKDKFHKHFVTVLSWSSHHGCLTTAVSYLFSYPSYPALLLCSARLVLSSCTGFIVLTILSDCRVPAVLSQLLLSRFSCLSNFVPSSCPRCSLRAVMFWSSCLICPVPAQLFQVALSLLSCPRCPKMLSCLLLCPGCPGRSWHGWPEVEK